MGVLYSNVANNSVEIVNDIHALTRLVTLPGTSVTVPANAFNGLPVTLHEPSTEYRLAHILSRRVKDKVTIEFFIRE